jgi:hypothetical protein
LDAKTEFRTIAIKLGIGYLGDMKIPRHIVWSFDKAEDLDLSDPENRKWWIKQVLMNGRMEDIRSLDLDEIERVLPDLYLPKPIRKLWSDYFAKRRTSNPVPEKSA